MSQHVGYKRVSTVQQNTDRQLANLQIELSRVFEDKATGTNTDRPALIEMLKYLREGDHLYTESIDRLCRSLPDLQKTVGELTDNGVTVHFLKEGLIFTGEDSPMNKLLLGLLGAVADFEADLIRERRLFGIQKAKAAGRYKGRPKSVSDEEIHAALDRGLSIRVAAKELGCGVSTVSKVSKARSMN